MTDPRPASMLQPVTFNDSNEDEPVHPCCGGWREHKYRCPARVWPATATPEIRRSAVRGDCIAPAHAQIEDLMPPSLDYQQRKQLTGILARVWDDGFEYRRQLLGEPVRMAPSYERYACGQQGTRP